MSTFQNTDKFLVNNADGDVTESHYMVGDDLFDGNYDDAIVLVVREPQSFAPAGSVLTSFKCAVSDLDTKIPQTSVSFNYYMLVNRGSSSYKVNAREVVDEYGVDPAARQAAFETWAYTYGWTLRDPECTGKVWGDPLAKITEDSNMQKVAYMSIQPSAHSAIISSGNRIGTKVTSIGSSYGYASVTRNGCSSLSYSTWDGEQVRVAYYDINQNKYIQKDLTNNYSEFTIP